MKLPPPLLSMTIFITRIFSKQRRVPRRSFSALYDKKFSTENRDIPHLVHIFLPYPFFSESRGSPLRNFLSVSDKKNHQKRDAPISPAMQEIFYYQNFSKHRRIPLRVFRHCVTKKWTKKCDTLPLIHEIFPYQNISETQGSPQRKFSVL